MLNKLNPFAKKANDDTQSVSTNNTSDSTKKKGVVGKIKDKAVSKMLEKQLANVPAAQRDMLMTAVKNNPDFFEKIAKLIKEEQARNGGNEMAASMKVMRENQGELMKIMAGGK